MRPGKRFRLSPIVAIAHPTNTARTIRGNFFVAHPNLSGLVSGNATYQELTATRTPSDDFDGAKSIHSGPVTKSLLG
jgi:hypothetical protein